MIDEETYPETLYRFEIGGICAEYPNCHHQEMNKTGTLQQLGEMLKDTRGVLLENYCLFCTVFANSEAEVTKELILEELRIKLKCDEAHLDFFDSLLHSFHIISKRENLIGGVSRKSLSCVMAGGELLENVSSWQKDHQEEEAWREEGQNSAD